MQGKAGSFTTFVLILIANLVRCACGAGCGQEELLRCSAPLPGLSSPAELAITLSREELENTCTVLQAGIRCINNYTSFCLEPHERRSFNSMYEGVNSVMSSLCQPGRYQDDYLRLSSCIKLIKPEYELCNVGYESALKRVSGKDGDRQAERSEYLRTVCCSFQEYLACSEQAVKRGCAEAADFTGAVLKKMSGNIIKNYCLEYSEEECRLANSGSNLTSHWLILTTVAIALFARFGTDLSKNTSTNSLTRASV